MKCYCMHWQKKVSLYPRVLSGTLKAIGVADELLDSTLRFSFSTDTTIEQIDYALEQLCNLLPMLRRFIRK